MAGIKILQNKSLKVTPPNEFNDPFEFATGVIGKINQNWLINIIKDEASLRERYDSMKNALWEKPFEQFREEQSALLNDPVWLADTVRQATLLHQDWANNFVDKVSLGAGVVCFTEDKESILMWSHYASNHEGFMIGFDIEKLPFAKIFTVDYSKPEPTVMDLHLIDSEEYMNNVYVEIMKRKAPCWSYEKEYRLEFLFQICEYLPAIKMYFYKFHPEVMQEIYIGNKCRKDDRERLLDLLNQHEFRHVRAYDAELVKNKYMIKYINLK